MKRLWKIMEEKINKYSIRKKLMLLYICCVILPLFITDSVILTILVHSEKNEQIHELENIASAVQADLTYTFEELNKMANTIYINREVSEFLDRKYASDLEFYTASRDMGKRIFYGTSVDSGNINVVMCSDNETIVNGGHFYRLSSVKEEAWYQKLQESQKAITVHFYYIGDENPAATSKRKVSLVRKLDYYKDLKCEKIIRLDFDYSTLVSKLTNMNYSVPVYVCLDNKILFSNVGHGAARDHFSYLTGKEKFDMTTEFNLYGDVIKIHIMKPENNIYDSLKQYSVFIILMLAVNVLLPWFLTVGFNRSFTARLWQLSEAFDQIEAESLKEISNIKGSDEISSLMRNYNRMVRRSRELIKTVYKDRLEKQKMDIARQNAELLALHSQINPHFLFNVLESIRMHSVIKGEEETAGMIERLAVLERQNVNWKTDFITIKEELAFIEAYLDLQKYRFGERLSYQIEVKEECLSYFIPKLTLVTFVENACVHGIEKKAVPCWIYVRVYHKDEWLYMEVEDTGDGMEEAVVEELQEKMRSGNIETLLNNEHVGVVNACLRLRMVTNNKAEFELESEQKVGTFMTIRVPIESLCR